MGWDVLFIELGILRNRLIHGEFHGAIFRGRRRQGSQNRV